jgi:tRNA A64-2'-O-ribosylphosphate transferase
MFWRHKGELLRCPRHGLSDLVSSLVASGSSQTVYSAFTGFAPSAINQVGGRILICPLSEVPLPPPTQLQRIDSASDTSYIFIRPETSEIASANGSVPSPPILSLPLVKGKKGQDHFLRSILPYTTKFACTQLEEGRIVVIACADGKDASVGVALSVIQMCFNVNGHYTNSGADTATKESIRTRLQWIIASRPEANPSRTTLKRVNEFLLSPVGFRPWQVTS